MSIKAIRMDNGGEYFSDEFEKYLIKNGIHHDHSVPRCPQQNGVAEHKNGLIQETARAMLHVAGMPQRFWAEASLTAVYIQNRLPTVTMGVTPFEHWKRWRPNVGHFEFSVVFAMH